MSGSSKVTFKRLMITSALVASVAAGALGSSYVFVPGPSSARAEALAAPNQQQLSFADVVERVSPAVVSIKVKARIGQGADNNDDGAPDQALPFPPGSPFEQFFKRFGMPQNRNNNGSDGRNHLVMAQGSGFFISADGYVVTNNHVVDNAAEVTVSLNDGTEYKAKVIGSDAKTDLALVKVDEKKTFPYVAFGKGNVRVGDWVVAVGNPFGLGGSVTAGIVSARGRDIGAGPYDDFLQIDAPINKGNSGGPTFNLNGDVVGVNTAIYSPSGGSVGIGFAIPSEVAQKVINDIKSNGKVTRGWLGVQIQPVSQDVADSIGLGKAEGALITEPQANSPALAAGLRSGDAITAVDGHKIANPKELARVIADYPPESDVKVTIWRDGASKDVTVHLGAMPARLDMATSQESTPAAPGRLDRYGLTVQPASRTGDGDTGLVVTDLDPSGVAAEKGIQQGDIILDVGGIPVKTPRDMEKLLAAAANDGKKAVLLRVKSGDRLSFIALSLAKA